ncbi:hypothetical protein BA195_06850 [Tenacibaculum soleae]|uniref:M23ase beta-sheet core domain-containing protein n=1 Tax=Tenacibaculum soleae TaxID=447689 RepID=A0A1B9Y3M4_9FLAO|nr:M23 family metallopeptidase [Tenacibaculum soleae]OCK44390.1 hypothetical protein BA195_06850 [Tenacibaculum soleae]
MHLPLKKIIDRGNDPTGFGHFGAKRGTRKHKGHDIISVPGESVVSMIDGVVTKIGYAYKNALQFRYVEVTNDTYRVWLMYLEHANLKVGQTVCAGQRVGYAMDIAKYHNAKRAKKNKLLKKSERKKLVKMINHLHVQIWKNGKLVDPKPYLI